MGATSDAAIRTGAAEFLHPSEDVIATLVVSVRGHQQTRAGGVAGIVGGARAGRARKAAEGAGIELASPMALVLTSRRLLTFETGRGGNVKAMLNELVLQEVGGLEVRRVGLGASLTLTCGTPRSPSSRGSECRGTLPRCLPRRGRRLPDHGGGLATLTSNRYPRSGTNG
jgi:hypothetical protein